MAFRYLMTGLVLAGLPLAASARPVSYPGGWTVMQMNDGDRSSLHVHYSPTARDSIGVYVERNWSQDLQFSGLQYNRLVKRWNGRSSQGNLYAKAALGQVDPFGDADSGLGGFASLAADWETRRWFTSYETRLSDFLDNESVHHSARLGVAPYIGDFGDLHTWLMVQVDNQPEADHPVTTTPLIRFFKGVQMLELGYTVEDEEFLANWIIRF